MKRTLPKILGSLLLLSSCSLVTDAEPSDLEFSWEPTQIFGTIEDSEPEVSASVGTLSVNAALSAPDPCQHLTGRLYRSGSRLLLRVRIISEEDVECPGVTGNFRYSAVVRGLDPRTYELRVVHEYVRTGWATRTVLEREIAVD